MDFRELFNRITSGLAVDRGMDAQDSSHAFWTAEAARGMIKYSRSPKRELLWGHDRQLIHAATDHITFPIYASHMRINEDGSTSVTIEPGYIAELIPRMMTVPAVARAFSPRRDAEEKQQMRFDLSDDDIYRLFRSAYITQADYRIPSSSSSVRNRDQSPGRS